LPETGQWLLNGKKAETKVPLQDTDAHPYTPIPQHFIPLHIQVKGVKVANINTDELYAMTQMTTVTPLTSTLESVMEV